MEKADNRPKNVIERVIEELGGNVKAIAEKIGVERKTLTTWRDQGYATLYNPTRYLGELSGTNPDVLAGYAAYRRELQKKTGSGSGDGGGARNGAKNKQRKRRAHNGT